MDTFGNFIDGDFRAARSGKVLTHISPADGRETAVADSDLLDLVSAIQAANKAEPNFSKLSPEDRARFLSSISHIVENRKLEIAQAAALDVGTPIRATLEESVPKLLIALKTLQFSLLGAVDSAHTDEKWITTRHRQSGGVAAIITGFSDAAYTIGLRVGAAIAAGSTIVCKPSSRTPRVSRILAEIFKDAGLPTGVYNSVQGRGAEVGAAIAQHPGLSTISFVGTDQVARLLAREAAENLKRVHYSLSAKNPLIVFQGVELEKVSAVIAKIVCGANASVASRASRIFVQETIYNDFRDSLKRAIEKLKIGNPLEMTTDIGPLPSRAHADRFESISKNAVNEKGKPVTIDLGSALPSGPFVTPSLVYDLTNCSTIHQEEVVGPFATLTSFKYQHDALKHANTSPYGHFAYVFEPTAKAQRVAQKLEVGRVWINSAEGVSEFRLGHTPQKHSGLASSGAVELTHFFGTSTMISHFVGP